jgi:alkylation response protein AidB-like acyl-CoA dehydrogenase
MALTAAQLEQQKKQAEELLFSGPQTLGFAKGLSLGHFNGPLLFPIRSSNPRSSTPRTILTELPLRRREDRRRRHRPRCRHSAVRHRRSGKGWRSRHDGAQEFGGRAFSQLAYCKIMELIGGHCPSTAVFVNAHHSIGIRALLLFGTEEQKKTWLPDLVSGKKLAAFALTEPEAGSDAANVQTTAAPTEDGSAYILNGEKRYITNGAIAQVLTVMARTPVPGSSDTRVTAFLVTPDLPGFKVVEARMPKCGIRGTATARLAFENMRVPKENVLGPVGKGLRVALTVLDFGRTTFGASCTGATKACLRLAAKHASACSSSKRWPSSSWSRRRSRSWLLRVRDGGDDEPVRAFIDRGFEDYMLETALLKVWSTDVLWTIVNDAFQIYGGAAYFTDRPLERMLRDARINQIGEGANDAALVHRPGRHARRRRTVQGRLDSSMA